MEARTGTHPLIGLCGYAGAGKDTAAHLLLQYGWERRAYNTHGPGVLQKALLGAVGVLYADV